MEITVHLPNDLDQHPEPAREAVEALAIAGYRSGTLSAFQASRILGLSRFEFEGFLKDRNILDHAYDAGDLQSDVETLERINQDNASRG